MSVDEFTVKWAELTRKFEIDAAHDDIGEQLVLIEWNDPKVHWSPLFYEVKGQLIHYDNELTVEKWNEFLAGDRDGFFEFRCHCNFSTELNRCDIRTANRGVEV